MAVNDVSSIAGASREIERARRAEQERAYSERLYRSVRRAIDDACELVEQVNLAGGGDCPAEVARLIEYLGLLADEPQPAPASSLEAHHRLFSLASALLGWPRDGRWAPVRREGRAA
ncbi:MAG TPA: hypothetical protein VOB72_23060 [Candidatus Dormibacteraeota bacterium]|nr:hypothetical protein [Candidatus Dormibacteraeota bacterium]